MPRVSINLCCYNSERFLEHTLQSIWAQTYTDWELVIINDGSTDGTEAVIRRHMTQDRPMIYFPTPHNLGLGAARNLALKRSSGECIAFIDHDDVWMPHKLACQLPLFDDHPRVGLVYSNCVNVWETGYRFRQFDKLRPCDGDAFRQLLVQYPVSIQTAVIHRRVLQDGVEAFDPRFRVLEDLDFVLRVARDWHLAFVEEPLVRVAMRRTSATRTHRDRFPIEMRLILEKLRAHEPGFDQQFAGEAARFMCEIARLEARIAWERNQRSEALERLQGYRQRFPEARRDAWLIRWLPYRVYDGLRLLAGRLAGMSEGSPCE
ncbi:MAG: hypothetical protein A3I71_06110 [Omnitrophica WOR_2 bacterium RIFCSPLOWO2_02_FULL_63_16]|nr:MAG: hypothetical protein A3I71_06110 [Omnitrophica WOR_2 bacterium RIFCSPLOWO2_02_FULL_63_16]OGX48165.1 MAG: hypothetical protein A3G88_04040 [Omnitrophica WOR_2 bacterium RIFCSPLOWO2_12_FULL_63_16]